jgi:hypothetical protein
MPDFVLAPAEVNRKCRQIRRSLLREFKDERSGRPLAHLAANRHSSGETHCDVCGRRFAEGDWYIGVGFGTTSPWNYFKLDVCADRSECRTREPRHREEDEDVRMAYERRLAEHVTPL